ncbi:efflux RND transporter periplasmic adaptor subunit [Mangrovibacterium lignilyticum]|uniref:efflux RND transporter periplasmic adaptor subunit n=1 Tax=Mangrovibacterium lignilyticum TaxID=2668052 RepID=UPI0013D0159C|nr:efflux RND transporter periplasmic adaptor subunit [Mangrovibacterium lignilyticum]
MIYNKSIWFGAFLLATALASCSSGKERQQPSEEIHETPPSVSGNQPEMLIVHLSDKEVKELKIETQKVSSDIKNYSLLASGVVFPATNHVSVISTPINGRVSAIMIRDGQAVQKGQELFKLESLVFGNLVSEYLQAIAEEKFQTTRLERMKQLVAQTISSKSELDRAMSDYDRARTASIAAVAKLKAIGVPDHEIAAIRNTDQIDPSLKIHAPISGSFDHLKVDLGQSVNALEQLGRIIDLDKVLIKGYLSPEEARFVNVGDTVAISQREDDRDKIAAYISSINPGLDEANRSVVINVEVTPENSWPKPGENVRLEISSRSTGGVYSIPLKAITYDGNKAVVFVKKDASVYEKRFVDIAEIRDQYAIVREGMKEDEEVAVSQVFSLKALSRYELIAEE